MKAETSVEDVFPFQGPQLPDLLATGPQDFGTSLDTMRRKHTLQTEETVTASKKKKLDGEHGRQPSIKPLDASDHLYTTTVMECAFCHSFRTTEVSGSMLHYVDGKPITAEKANHPGVIHVHEKCIEWTPLVYFSGETPINLKSELLRASKLKCNKCGKKGAALGCFYKSCRKSFHVPCAIEIPDCRWDIENYYVLCPLHSSKELPCDKSKIKKEVHSDDHLSAKIDSSTSKSEADFSSKRLHEKRWTAAPHATNGWILCKSALSTQEKDILDNFSNKTGASLTQEWKQNVTHVIASIDERGACTRTFKVLMATIYGKWVLSINWIKACMEAGHPVEEETYEIGHDIHGCVNGPKKGRLRAQRKAPKLFAGLNFYFSGPFNFVYKGWYEDLVRAAGGTVFNKEDFLTTQHSYVRGSPPKSYVLYNVYPRQDCASRDAIEIVRKRYKEAESVALNTGAQVVDQRWLVDAVANSSLEPI